MFDRLDILTRDDSRSRTPTPTRSRSDREREQQPRAQDIGASTNRARTNAAFRSASKGRWPTWGCIATSPTATWRSRNSGDIPTRRGGPWTA